MESSISEESVKEVQEVYRKNEKGLLNNENARREIKLPVVPTPLMVPKFNLNCSLVSPSENFWKLSHESDEASHSVSSMTSKENCRESKDRTTSLKLDCAAMYRRFKNWMKNPLSMAIFLWISCVAVSGSILFLVLTGMLNHLLPKKSQRDIWFEVNNQILNALFTLMCLYQHPKRFLHLVLLCRWKPKDILILRKFFCKNGTHKPHERAHISAVILLLHVNCFAQYALCGLNLGYKRTERPALGVGICLSVAIAAPVIAGLYCIVSPLWKDDEFDLDEEAQDQNFANDLRSNEQDTVENVPQWKGGLFEICNDVPTSCLSLFCGFCVHGWNMERLGFGNKYVHITTFFLLCTAPFFIFKMAANNIDHKAIKEAFGVTGIVLCMFGLLYGGFWRTRMRKKYDLPAHRLCCDNPAVTDYALWLFCCWCSLAQEIRTADFCDSIEGKFCNRQMNKNVTSFEITDSPKLSNVDKEKSLNNLMKPPIPLGLRREGLSQ